MGPLLETHGLSKSFGGLTAVSDLGLTVQRGDLLGLIGPNGAGKTTVFNLISGVLPASQGRVTFKGAGITGLLPHAIARRGLARTFQIPTLFHSFTALDNVVLGGYATQRRRPLALFRSGPGHGDAAARDRARELLGLLRLEGVRDHRVGTLPHGDQKKVELAVALASAPELVLLDEPFAGLNADEIEDMSGHITRLRKGGGITFVVVEHNMRALMRIADRVCVLNFGRKIAEGTPADISANPEVIRAYLGTRRHAAPR